MKTAHLDITYRKGRAIAAYIGLPRQPKDRSGRVERISVDLHVDYSPDGRPIGVEIISPTLLSFFGTGEESEMEDPIEMKNDTPRPQPTVQVIGMVDAKSDQIHRARAQMVADFFGMNIIIEDHGNKEELTFISGEKRIVLVAHGGVDGGFFGVKNDKESR